MGKKCLRACAKYADSHESAHAQGAILAFTLNSCILQYPIILLEDSEGPDQTAHLRSLIWAYAVRACPEDTFSLSTALFIMWSDKNDDQVFETRIYLIIMCIMYQVLYHESVFMFFDTMAVN